MEEAARARLSNVEERLSGMLQGIQAFVDADHVELGPADLPEQVRSDYWHETEDGRDRLALHVFPRGSIADPEDMEKFNAFVSSVDPEVTGLPVTFLEFGLMLRRGLENSALYAIGIILLLLCNTRPPPLASTCHGAKLPLGECNRKETVK